MDYKLRIQSAGATDTAVELTVREFDTKRSVADFVLDILSVPPSELIEAKMLPDAQAENMKRLQAVIFDRDEEGQFIREIAIGSDGTEVKPDEQFARYFKNVDGNGVPAKQCNLVVTSIDAPSRLQENANPAAGEAVNDARHASMEELARIMFLHQIAIGFEIDVTKELPELSDSLREAEKNGWIEVDVQKVSYRLTAEGKRLHDASIAEAQELIRRYDIFGDVEVDSYGTARFDTTLGRDFRVPVFELENVDPFRARFLLGINDGEWDTLSNWFELYKDPNWYQQIFAVVEQAPSVEEIGELTLRKVIDAGKARLREDSRITGV